MRYDCRIALEAAGKAEELESSMSRSCLGGKIGGHGCVLACSAPQTVRKLIVPQSFCWYQMLI